jgi:hypothetical protein
VSHCKSVKAHNQIQPFNLKPPAVPALKHTDGAQTGAAAAAATLPVLGLEMGPISTPSPVADAPLAGGAPGPAPSGCRLFAKDRRCPRQCQCKSAKMSVGSSSRTAWATGCAVLPGLLKPWTQSRRERGRGEQFTYAVTALLVPTVVSRQSST